MVSVQSRFKKTRKNAKIFKPSLKIKKLIINSCLIKYYFYICKVDAQPTIESLTLNF